MYRRKRWGTSRRAGFRRFRRRRMEVLPLSICRTSIDFGGGEDANTCDSYTVDMIPLLDGGALENALQTTYPTLDANRQTLTRGVSLARMQFDMQYVLVKSESNVYEVVDIYHALVVVDTYDNAGTRTPSRVPSILSRNKQETDTIIHRWHDMMLIAPQVLQGADDEGSHWDSSALSNNGAFVRVSGDHTSVIANGSGTINQRWDNVAYQPGGNRSTHLVRRKVFLSEQQALYLCTTIVPGSDANWILGLTVYGSMACRNVAG